MTDSPASASDATIRCMPSTSRWPSSPVSIANGAGEPGSGGTYRNTSAQPGGSRYAFGSANTTVSMPMPSHGPSSRSCRARVSVDLPALEVPLRTMTRPRLDMTP